MSETEVKAGQVYADRDKRMEGRHVVVACADELNAYVYACAPSGELGRLKRGAKPRRIALKTLRGRFTFVRMTI